jgi:hypothetical protein
VHPRDEKLNETELELKLLVDIMPTLTDGNDPRIANDRAERLEIP